MPFMTENDQQYFKHMVDVLFDKPMLFTPKGLPKALLPPLTEQIGVENTKELRDVVEAYAQTEGTVEAFKIFEEKLDQALREIQVKAGENASVWSVLNTRRFREHVIELVFNMTTDALIDAAERTAQEAGMTILPDEVKKIMLCFDMENSTEANFKELQRNLNQYLKEGIAYNKEKLDPSARMFERCLLTMKQLARKLMQFAAGILPCYKPSWNDLNSRFFSSSETQASKAFQASMEPLSKRLQAYAEACECFAL
jgi:hypothetical protein